MEEVFCLQGKIYLSMLMGITLVFTTIFSLPLQAQEVEPVQSSSIETDFGYSEDQLVKVFEAIENIPEEVVQQGEEATIAWLENYTGEEITLPSQPQNGVQTYGIVGCTSAIGLAIAGNLFAPAKLTKIKTAIQGVGGAKTFATTLNTTYKAGIERGLTKREAINNGISAASKNAGPEIQEALVDFFYVGTVYAACFE